VFIYVGFRPRFGPGPGTSIIAAVVVFLTAGLVMLLTTNDLGLLTGRKLWLTAAWALAEVIVATLIGAWIYREAA